MSCDCDVPIVARKEWGARLPKSVKNMATPVQFVFIHHTAMDCCLTQDECLQQVRTIQNFHMDDRNWDDIGYNFLIGEDGRVYEARGWNRTGAHTYGWNEKAVAFCVMGSYNDRLPNKQALSALQNIIAYGVQEGKITQDYKLYGHRDVRDTDCPGHKLYDLIKGWDHFCQSDPVKGTSTQLSKDTCLEHIKSTFPEPVKDTDSKNDFLQIDVKMDNRMINEVL